MRRLWKRPANPASRPAVETVIFAMRADGADVRQLTDKRQAESGLEYVSFPPRRAARRQDAAGPPSDEGAQRDDDGA